MNPSTSARLLPQGDEYSREIGQQVLDQILLMKEKVSLQKQSMMLREAERRDGRQSPAWVSASTFRRGLMIFLLTLQEFLLVPLVKS